VPTYGAGFRGQARPRPAIPAPARKNPEGPRDSARLCLLPGAPPRRWRQSGAIFALAGMLVRMHYAPTAYLWWSRAMLAPDQMVWRIPHWMRALLVGCFVVLVTGAGLFAYHYFTSPKTITIAAGSSDGEAVRLMSAIAVQLTKTGARIRLKITDSGSTLGAAQAFSAGKVDLAIVRADVGDLSAARTVVRVTYGVVMILVPPGSSA